uniref:TAFII55 protein conserved region domain-containing protein n=1 Tax=Strigamia maritima TaxID=126957 RepID=T1J0J9_STRMM
MSAMKDKDILTLNKLKDDIPVELESQFILRLPAEPAQELRRTLRSGVMNIKDRLTIQLENDMRHGIVRLDNWVFTAKLQDLPCVCESLKTIDKKTFYKTADVCQILWCKEEDDSQTTEEEESPKKKDEGKTEKNSFIHTAPLKNVRKRRFRKTLKKKYVDAPEIEKEVKRLFRVDNEAVSVRWDVITDEDDTNKKLLTGEGPSSAASPTASGFLLSNSQSLDVAEHDIFGEELSSSDDEHDVNIMDSGDDDSSRLSSGTALQEKREYMRQITKEILKRSNERVKDDFPSTSNQDHIITALKDAGLVKQPLGMQDQDALLEKRDEIQQQLHDVQARRQNQESDICSIENQALKVDFDLYLSILSI